MKNKIQAGWKTAKLNECCDFVRGVGFQNGDARTTAEVGFIPLLRAGNISSSLDLENDLLWIPERLTAKEQQLKKGDIAICLSSGSPKVVGKTAQLKQDWKGTVGAFCGIVRPHDDVDSEFIGHWFRSSHFINWRNAKARGANIQNLRFQELEELRISLPSTKDEQRQFSARLREQMAAVEKARAAVEQQLDAAQSLIQSLLRESLKTAGRQTLRIPDCLQEVTAGIGERWSEFPVLGATRSGLAPAKEAVGKHPGRYKPVTPGTVFYNPMRILLGSIAVVDEDDKPGITSPDYVVVRGIEGRLHSTWFYYWFRSQAGAAFILSLTRGAVRERLLFKRLAKAQITIPSWETQIRAVEQLRTVTKLCQSLSARLAEIERLPAALLRQAFQT